MSSSLFAQQRDTLQGVGRSGSLRMTYAMIVKHSPEDTGSKIPVFLFLHGAGERGNDNKVQLTVALPALMHSLDSLEVPSYAILAPQCPLDMKWVDTDWTLPAHRMAGKINPPLRLAQAILDSILNDLPRLDKDRIYLTGLSMGGFGVWDLLQRGGSGYAAAMPICGGGDPTYASLFRQIPVWAFHGQKDKLVQVGRTTEMVAALRKMGGDVQETIYPNLGHLCWNQSYQNLAAVKWLIAQRRK